MKKFRYTVNGKTYSLPESEVAGFLQEFPNAQLIEEISDTAGKQTGVAEKAVTTTPENVTADGGSSSEVISSESQPLRKRLEEQEEQRQAELNAVLSRTGGPAMYNYGGSGSAILPPSITKRIAGTIGGFTDIIKGLGEFVDMQMDAGVFSPINPLGPIPKLVKSYLTGEEDPDMVNTKGLEDFSVKLKSLNKKHFNDDGSQADFVDLVEQGRHDEAADELVSNVFIAAPSLAVAALPVIGIPTLTASAAGNAYERTMRENPDANRALAYAVSTTQGAVEGLSELAGIRFIKNGRRAFKFLAPKIGNKAAEKAVKESLKTTSEKFVSQAFNITLKTTGRGLGEGSTEGIANIINESLQEAVFNEGFQEGEFGMILRKSLNEVATGVVLGGGASVITTQANDPGVQNIAYQIAPNSSKLDVLNLEKQKLSLTDILSNTKRKKDQTKVQQQIDGVNKQISAAKADIVTTFESMTRKEKLDYAKSIDNINSKYDLLYNTNYKKTEKQIEALENEIKSEYKNLETAAYKKYGVDKKTEEDITQSLKAAEKITSKIRNTKFKDLDVKILNTPEQISKAQKENPGFKTSDGIFISKGTADTKAQILINLPVAAEAGATNVLGHEKLHYLLSKYFKTDNASLEPLVNSFKAYLQESGNGNILSRIDARIDKNYRNEDGTLQKEALEEYFNIFSDIVANEKVKVVEEKGIAAKLAKAYTNTMQGLGFAEVKLTNGKEVFDFIRNYTKHIQNSDKILGVKLVGDGKIQKVTPEDVTIKKSKSKEIDDAYEAGTPPFDITQLYEPLVNKLVNKYKNVPDFSVLREDLVQNALYEKGGVIDLINSYDGRGTLSGYVGKLLPLRMNKMASDLFGQKFTEDVTERVDVAAQETLPEQVEREETQQQELEVAKTQEKRNILDRANLSSELQLKALNAAKRTLGTMLPQIDIQKGKNFREKYKIAVRNMLFEDVSNELRAYSPTDYFGYIDLNAEALYDIMPLADLTKSQALKDLFLEQQFDKDGKPVRVLESFTGKKSYAGNLVFKKKPFKDVKQDFLNEFAKKHSNSVQRKAFIINTLAKEIAFDESMEALNDPNVLEKIPLTQDTAIKEFMEEFEMNIQRGRFTKYSKTLDAWVKENPLVNDTKLLLGLKDMKLGEDPAAQFKRVYTGVIPDETLDQIVYEISQLPKPRYIKHSITKSKAEGLADEIRNNFNVQLPFKTSGTTEYTPEQITKFRNQSKALVDNDYVDLVYLNSPGHRDKSHNLMLGIDSSEDYANFYNYNSKTFDKQTDSRLTVATDEKAKKGATSPKTKITVENQSKADFENNKALNKQKSIIEYYKGLTDALVDGVIDKEYLSAMLFHDTSGRSRNMLRRSSFFLGWVPEVMETQNANFEMEHPKPFTENSIELVNAVSLVSSNKSKAQNQKIIQNAFNKFFSQNVIIAIPYSLQTEYLSKDATLVGGFPFSRYSDNLLNQIVLVNNTGNINMDLFDKEKLAKQADKTTNDNIIKFSKSAPAEFSEMLDRKSKDAAVVRSDKDFALAANLGKKANYKNKWNIFLPYSAEDFYGLLQKTAGTGKQGDADLKFIKEKFLDPYDRGISNLEIDRRALLKRYRELKKEIKATPEKLDKNLSSIGLDAFTVEDAVRMFIWEQQGMAVPNISKTNSNKLVNYVQKNSDLRKFAFGLIRANKQDKYPEPDNNWFAGNIGIDLSNSINKNKRSKYLETWNKNINLILNDKNKTKLTAAFGTDYVKNLESIIARMKSGTNRRVTDSKIVNGTLDFINGSVGTIMFFNMRSASLQLISAANYLNWSDNNPLQAGKALANVPQYTKDLMRLLNSDFLVNRRNGLKINIQEAELADAVKSDNKFKAIMATILKAGFIPTQIADSLAIAGGGATFYRNRLNTYLKEGLSEKNAEAKAYNDWRQIANDSQQSSDASRISNIQASDFGRLVFAFANTPFQYTRLTSLYRVGSFVNTNVF